MALCISCYCQRPEVKERHRASLKAHREKPESKEKLREYRQKPGVKERIKEHRIKYLQKPEIRKKRRDNQKAHREKPDVKERIRETRRLHNQNPEVKKRINKMQNKRLQNPELKEEARRRVSEYRKTVEGKNKLNAYYRKPEVKERKKARGQKSVHTADDRYIKLLINKKTQGILKANDMPSELIEAQRQSLILKRTIKQKQKKDEQHNTATDL
jgi:hypothetical protein